MRYFTLKKEGALKLLRNELSLSQSFLEESIKSCVPGELVALNDKVKNKKYYAFINTASSNGQEIEIISNVHSSDLEKNGIESYIRDTIKTACEMRGYFAGYGENAREFYGNADGLPGLIIDSYENLVIVQINSAGVDQYRQTIKETLQGIFTKEICFLDNEKYREKHGLPQYEKDPMPEVIYITENDFKYELQSSLLQKIGYYYDHRENRKKFENLLKRMNLPKRNGLDLFCYIGSWGMHALRAGVEKMTFVDQGNLSAPVLKNLEINQFHDRGAFVRESVFKFLDDEIAQGNQYDVICSDPPAFAKSKKEKNNALEGYLKLHRKLFRLASQKSIVVAASCTHYVSHEEFQNTVVEAAQKENAKITLLENGVQGFDHPSLSTSSYNNYIKYYAYLVRKV